MVLSYTMAFSHNASNASIVVVAIFVILCVQVPWLVFHTWVVHSNVHGDDANARFVELDAWAIAEITRPTNKFSEAHIHHNPCIPRLAVEGCVIWQ